MSNTDKLREFAEKYKTGGYRIVNDYAGNKTMQRYDNENELLSDLTALLSEHYYPKEYCEWLSSLAINAWSSVDDSFNHWKENEQ